MSSRNPSIAGPEQAISFLQQLIRLKSVNPPGNEEQVAHFIADYFKQIPGCVVRLVEVDAGRPNVEIVYPSQRKTTPALLLTGHLDTVLPGDLANWQYDPFGAELIDGRIYGRGTSDMKSGLAAMLLAIAMLAHEQIDLASDIIFLGTVGEEVDQRGARAFFESGGTEHVGAVVVGEPTNGHLGPAHKGALHLRLTTYGRTAHGSTPELGVNAVKHMIALVQEIDKRVDLVTAPHELLRPSTMALTTLIGGIQTNVIPDRAQATLDIRTVPDLEHGTILQQIEQAIAELTQSIPDFRVTLEILINRPAIATSLDDVLIAQARSAYHTATGREPVIRALNYFTDASVLSSSGLLPTLIYGPGDDRLAHQPDEYVEVDAYLDAIAFYYQLAAKYGKAI